jgi:hypothetical protein
MEMRFSPSRPSGTMRLKKSSDPASILTMHGIGSRGDSLVPNDLADSQGIA